MKRQRGKIVALSTSRKKGVSKTNVDQVTLKENWGIEGDAHAGEWHRQVSLLAVESIAKMLEKGADVTPGAFAENITTEEVDLLGLQVGDVVIAGSTRLEITQIGKECHHGCAIFEQVGDCVMPREGLFARVLAGGTIQVGDVIEVASRGKKSDSH